MEFAMREGGFLRYAMASPDADDEADDDEEEEEDEGYVGDQPASLPLSHSASPDALERHNLDSLVSVPIPVPRRPRPLWEVAPYLYRYRPQRKTPLLRSHSWDEAWYSREVREVAGRTCSLKMAGMKCPFCSKPEINFFEQVHLNRILEANRSSKPASNANRPGFSQEQQPKDGKGMTMVIRRPLTATAPRPIPRMGVSATERREHTFKDAVQHLDVLPVGLEMSAPREALFRSIAVPRVLALPKTVPGMSSFVNNDTAMVTPRPRRFSPATTTPNTNDETVRHSPTSVACSINSMPNFARSSNEDTLPKKLKNKSYEVSSLGRDLFTDSCKVPEPVPKKAKTRRHKVRRNQQFLSTCHVYRHPATDSQVLEDWDSQSARRYLTHYDVPQLCLPQKVLEVGDSPVAIVGNEDLLVTRATDSKSTDLVASCLERPQICPDKLGEDSTEGVGGIPGRKHRRHSSFQLNTAGSNANYEGEGEGSTTIQINAPGNVELRMATTKVVSVIGRTSPDVSGVEFSIRFHDQNQDQENYGGDGGQPSYWTWRRSSAPCTDITSIDKSYPVDLRPQELLSICNDDQENSTEVDFDSSLYCRDKFLRNRAVFVGQESKPGTNVNTQSAASDNKPGSVKLTRECSSVGQCHLPNDRGYNTRVTSAEAMPQDTLSRRAIDSQSREFDYHSPAHAQIYQVRHEEQPIAVPQPALRPEKFENVKQTMAPPNSSTAGITKETTGINTPRCYGDKADCLGSCGGRQGDAGSISNVGSVKEPFSTDVIDMSAYVDIRHKVLEAKHLMDEVFNKIRQNGEEAGVGCKASFPNCCTDFSNSQTFSRRTPGNGASNTANLDTQSTAYLAHRWETDYAPALETQSGLKAVSPDTNSSFRCGNTADWPGENGKMKPCQSCSPRPATMSSHPQVSEAGPGASGCQQNGWPGDAYNVHLEPSLLHTGTGLPSAQPWNRNPTDRNKRRTHHSLTSPDKTTIKQSLSLEDDAINSDQPECEDNEVADILSVVNYTEQVNRIAVLNEAIVPVDSSPFAAVSWSRDASLEKKKKKTEILMGPSPSRVPCEQSSQEWVLAHDLEDGKPRFRPIVAELSLQEIHYGELHDGYCTAV